MSATVVVTDNRDASRLEASVDGDIAELIYRLRAGRLVLIHTGVPPSLEGRGVGGKLVQAAIDWAGRDGLVVVPLCPFARGWLKRHPDTASKADIDWGDTTA